MERELRRLRRAIVHETVEEKKNVNDATDRMEKNYQELIIMLKAQVKSYGAVIVESKVQLAKLHKKIDEYAKYVEELEFKANVRGNMLQMQEKILLRARHLEVHAEYLSLGYPPVPDATLPALSFDQWHHYRNMTWCTDEKEKEKVEDLENFYFDDAVEVEDFRIPSVYALIKYKSIPYPPETVTNCLPECYKNSKLELRHLCHLPVDNLPSSPRARDRSRSPVRGKRPATPCPYEDAPTESDSDDGYEIVPVVKHDGDIIGPSTYRE